MRFFTPKPHFARPLALGFFLGDTSHMKDEPLILLSETTDGYLIVETEYDEQILIDGRWWSCDLYTGELRNEMVVH